MWCITFRTLVLDSDKDNLTKVRGFKMQLVARNWYSKQKKTISLTVAGVCWGRSHYSEPEVITAITWCVCATSADTCTPGPQPPRPPTSPHPQPPDGSLNTQTTHTAERFFFFCLCPPQPAAASSDRKPQFPLLLLWASRSLFLFILPLFFIHVHCSASSFFHSFLLPSHLIPHSSILQPSLLLTVH